MVDLSGFRSLSEMAAVYSTDQACKECLSRARWGEDVICPYCGHHHCHRSGKRYSCPNCQNKFSVTVGTIFQNSKIGLRKWFMAIYLISYHKKGVSSCQLSRDLSVTQKTAWYMLSKLRRLLVQKECKLGGSVEMDECYLGGKVFFMHRSRKKGKKFAGAVGKAPVFGIIRRGRQTTVRAWMLPKLEKKSILDHIQETVRQGSKVFTDESSFYDGLSTIGYSHYICNHALDAYCWGKIVHTNSIEGFWAHLRKIYATYHKISKDHLQHYIDEAVFRWNNRSRKGDQVFNQIFRRCLVVVTCQDIRSSHT